MKFIIDNIDCIDGLKELEDKSIDLILTDPPYNLGLFMNQRQTNLGKMRENFFGDAGWDLLTNEEWLCHMSEFLFHANRVLKNKGNLIIFMSILKVESLVRLAEKYKFYYKTTGIWHKTNPMPRNMNLHFINSNECWIHFVNNSRTGVFNNMKLELDFIESSVTPSSEKKFGKHPTQKPVKIMEYFINLLSNENDTILDPFMGSGTTGVACKKLKRNFIGYDLNKEYCEIALKRLNNE